MRRQETGEPCSHLERSARPGSCGCLSTAAAFCADILTAGTIMVGDRVTIADETGASGASEARRQRSADTRRGNGRAVRVPHGSTVHGSADGEDENAEQSAKTPAADVETLLLASSSFNKLG